MIATLFGQPLKIRQAPLSHEPIGELGVLAVQADDDQPTDPRLGIARPPDKPPRHAEGPEDQRRQRQYPGGEECKERSQEDEAGARAHVGQGRRRQRQE